MSAVQIELVLLAAMIAHAFHGRRALIDRLRPVWDTLTQDRKDLLAMAAMGAAACDVGTGHEDQDGGRIVGIHPIEHGAWVARLDLATTATERRAAWEAALAT